MKCIAVLFSAAHLLLLSVPAADGRVVDLAASRREKQFRTVGKVNSGTLDFVALRAAETTETKHFFRHGRHLLDALAGGHATFEVAEIENDDAAWNLHAQSSYHEIADKAFHDTRTVYTLHGGDGAYVNLDGVPDHHAAAAVRDISDTHLVHCPAPGGAGGVTAAPAPGALVVGSAGGPWSTAAPPHVARFLESSLRRLHPHHAAAKREHGLLIARRVAAVRRLVDDGHGCLHLETEDVHPLELFSKMRLESYIEQPQRFYSGLTAATMAAHRQRHDPTKPTANPDSRALFTETPYFNANLGYPTPSRPAPTQSGPIPGTPSVDTPSAPPPLAMSKLRCPCCTVDASSTPPRWRASITTTTATAARPRSSRRPPARKRRQSAAQRSRGK